MRSIKSKVNEGKIITRCVDNLVEKGEFDEAMIILAKNMILLAHAIAEHEGRSIAEVLDEIIDDLTGGFELLTDLENEPGDMR